MNKKILSLTILFIALVLIPVTSINATQVYVGVQVSAAHAPGCVPGTSNCGTYYPGIMTDNNWCLPVGSQSYYNTQMAVATTEISNCYLVNYNYQATDVCNNCSGANGSCIPAATPSTNPVSAVYPTCAGGNTLWSGLLDLTSGGNYQIYLYAPNFCPGYLNGYCWVSDTVSENCCDICSHYGLTAAGGESNCANSSDCYTPLYYDDSNCTMEAKLMGSACSSCTTGVSTYSYFDPSPSSKACFTTYGGSSYYSSCSAVPSGYSRVCACNYSNTAAGFLFPFTASF